MMQITPETDDLCQYLQSSSVVNYIDSKVRHLAERFIAEPKDEITLIKEIYEYVRDNIHHSFDVKTANVTCSASEVLQAGHGICFAKAHLLAALLRYAGVPTGFCYQKLILDDQQKPVLILHGLNAVYLKSQQRWLRIDARGNKPGVNAQFSPDKECLAFPIRPEYGESDEPIIYRTPNRHVVHALKTCKTTTDLYNNLPTAL